MIDRIPRAHSANRSLEPITSVDGGRYRMVALAYDDADAVQSAGGLLFDRIKAGWNVELRLAECRDQRALNILGIRSTELVVGRGLDTKVDWPDSIIAAENFYLSDALVRGYVNAGSRRTGTEVNIWGGSWPAELPKGIGSVEHRLSAAARVFKTHALRAAGLPSADVPANETFCSGRRRIDIAAPLQRPS